MHFIAVPSVVNITTIFTTVAMSTSASTSKCDYDDKLLLTMVTTIVLMTTVTMTSFLAFLVSTVVSCSALLYKLG